MRKVSYTLGLLLLATPATAGSLKICFTDVGPDAARVEAFAGLAVLYADILPGSVTNGSTICSTNPIPSTLVRGIPQPITLRAWNSLGEVGPASNAITFRTPLIPPILSDVTVQGVTGP